jgi:opacity protein-like surface antigen
MLMNGFKPILSAATLFAFTSSFAFAFSFDEGEELEPYYELILMGGIATIDADDLTVELTNGEIDLLTQTNETDWDAWTGRIGVGYVYGLSDASMQWFPTLSPQLNFYYLNGNINGDLSRPLDPHIDSTHYDMELTSKRLMFDLALTVVRFEALSIYALGGAGVAWNEIDFDSRKDDDFHLSNQDLETESSAGFAYEFGGGLTYTISDEFGISAEYLYTGLTDVLVGAHEFEEDVEFDLTSQAVLVGFRFTFQ